MAKQETLQGTVIWFSIDKGFGFIKREDGEKDLFVHYTAIQTVGFKTLLPDQKVEFSVEEGQQGLQASHVRLVITNAENYES